MRSFNRGDLLLSYIMSRLPVLLAVLFYGVVEAFVWSPALLAGRGNAVYTKSWGSGTAQPVSAARLTGPRRGTTGVLTPPQMSLMRLAEEDLPISPEQTNLPISPDQQESIISTLSLASSVLLLFIICGAAYLTLVDWKNKQELKKSDDSSTGQLLPPEVLPEKPLPSEGSEEDEEGNRLYRRMAKKERRKAK